VRAFLDRELRVAGRDRSEWRVEARLAEIAGAGAPVWNGGGRSRAAPELA
jgi:hypothetical protein